MTRRERNNKFSLKQVARYVCQTLLLSFVSGADTRKAKENEEQSTVRLWDRKERQKRGTDELGK